MSYGPSGIFINDGEEGYIQESGYASVTESPGIKASTEQTERLLHRYHFAAQFCAGKDVLEVACGTGMGLGYLAKTSKKVVGGDIDDNNLEFARRQYKGRRNIEIMRLDAHKLPFENGSFDVVILYEAVYYLKEPERFFGEARRVLRGGGIILMCSVNKDWQDFSPSPFSTRYFSVPELRDMMGRGYSGIEFFGAFEAIDRTVKGRMVSWIKRCAVSLHLMPKTMKGKEFFKRIFFGRLSELPAELSDDPAEEYSAPVPITADTPNKDYKVIYAVAHTG